MVQEGNCNSTVRSAMSSYLNLGTDLSAVEIIKGWGKLSQTVNLCLLTEISIVNTEFEKRKNMKQQKKLALHGNKK